jgi:hypothetical protein
MVNKNDLILWTSNHLKGQLGIMINDLRYKVLRPPPGWGPFIGNFPLRGHEKNISILPNKIGKILYG